MQTIIGVALFDTERNCVLVSMSKPFRHGSLFAGLAAANDMFDERYKVGINPENIIQGFITDTGQFLNRFEAKKLAVKNGQFIAREDNKYFKKLFSEDIW